MIVILLAISFLAAVSLMSAVEVKIKKYRAFAKYYEKKGYSIIADILCTPDTSMVMRNSEDVRQVLAHAEDVLTVAKLWDTTVGETAVNCWCYSEDIVHALSPEMESGRWFRDSDEDADRYYAVVSYNKNGISTGDVIEVANGYTETVMEVEIIGVLKENESVYYTDPYASAQKNFMDNYYVYDYDAEEQKPLLIFSDQQIYGCNGERFWALNPQYIKSENAGVQRQVTACTIVTYPDDVSDAVMEEELQELQWNSFIYSMTPLSEVQSNSRQYIMKELYSILPIIVCTLVFIMIAAISAGAVSVKKQLKNYAVYYVCGMQWNRCAQISLIKSCIDAGVAFVLMGVSFLILLRSGRIQDTALHFGMYEVLACLAIAVLYMILSWIMPLRIVRHTSAKKLLVKM